MFFLIWGRRLSQNVVGGVGCLFWLSWILFFLFFLFCLTAFIALYVFFSAVVRSINKSGTKPTDSTVQAFLQDPLSCRQRPFTGNFLIFSAILISFRFSSTLFFEGKK